MATRPWPVLLSATRHRRKAVQPQPQPSARLHPWRWAWAGAALGLAATVLSLAPAAWLAHAVAHASEQRIVLADTQGTVWNGSARLLLSAGQHSRDATALPTRVHWRMRLRWPGADASLHSDCCTQATPLHVQVRQHWGITHVQVSDVHLQLPSALLSGLGTPWNTLQPQGQLSLSTQQLHWRLAHQRVDMHGSLHIALRDASTRMSTLRPLGHYDVAVQGSLPDAQDSGQQPVTLTLSSQPGSSLILQGTGQFTGGRLRFSGEARATAERADALNNLLNVIGRRDGARSVISLG